MRFPHSKSSSSPYMFLVLWLCAFVMGTTKAAAACQSCLVSTAAPFVMSRLTGKQSPQPRRHHVHHHHHHSSGTAATAVVVQPMKAFLKTTSPQLPPILRKFALGHSYLQSKKWGRTWLMTQQEKEQDASSSQGKSNDPTIDKQQQQEDTTTAAVSDSMVFAIGLYKNYISPLLPPACRFLPTCSQYGVQAIEKYGPTKGFVLTAWRILRCSPIGGRGYDPPQWPPVNYFYASY